MKTLPKTDLGFERGCPFVMAWVYLPSGPQLYTGSLGKIRAHLKDGPTCHGFIRYFQRGMHPIRHACLFGKLSLTNYRKNKDHYLHLSHYSEHDLRDTEMFQSVRQFLHPTRRLWVLTEETPDATRLLGKWRKLPATYLRALRECEKCAILKKKEK